MRAFRWLLLGVLVAIVPIFGRAAAPVAPPPAASFHGIGDLPGGPTVSVVRDATKADGTIYAVGGGAGLVQNICTAPNTPQFCVQQFNADTAVLWTWDGVTATLTAQPNLATGGAYAQAGSITRDAAYIASQARSNGPSAVRVARSAIAPLGNTNVQLTVAGSLGGIFRLHDDLGGPGLVPNVQNRPQQAVALAESGSVLYSAVNSFTRAARFDIGTNTSALIPLTGGRTANLPASRGTSSDGAVLVGTGFVTLATATNQGLYADRYNGTTGLQAFRYVHASGASTPILRPTGGTWSKALAVSPDGNRTLVAGDSADYPNGEVYVHDTTQLPANSLTSLGSPNTGFVPTSFGGMTSDGSVAAVTFSGDGNFRGSPRFAYFRNSHGWFHLTSALAAAGADILSADWNSLQITGMSSDGTLVFGQAEHNGNLEGFVAEFDAGYLAAFEATAVAPTNTTVVGAWMFHDRANPTDTTAVAFMADGSYYTFDTPLPGAQFVSYGFERGLYVWNPATDAFSVTTLQSTSGDGGLSGANGDVGLRLAIAGNTATFYDPNEPDFAYDGVRITDGSGSSVGGWILGDARAADSSTVIVMLGDGTYYLADDGPRDLAGHDGIEVGTYSIDAGGVLLASTTIDTNGQWGFSHPSGTLHISLSADGLGFTASDDLGSSSGIRIIDPNAVRPAITSPLTGGGTLTVPFSYTVTATHGAFNFDATGLPSGLSINSGTGLISGTPTASGTFPVTLSASNTLATGTDTLSLVIDAPNTSTGSNVIIQPEVPAGAPPIGLTFGAVTQAGETSVTVIDPTTTPDAPLPPSGFVLGDPPIYYDIETTATFTGEVTVCLNYTGATFGAGTPRLFHFTGSVWTDITTSVDTVNNVICGLTSSFSPFAIFVSPITRTGFYAPVSSVAGAVNTVKGGSTVPLKFNVYVNGVEKTDTTGLTFGMWAVACSNSGAEDPVDFTTTGGTSLRYDAAAGAFVQNWKTPKAPGCYFVRMTTADGLSIGALFKVK